MMLNYQKKQNFILSRREFLNLSITGLGVSAINTKVTNLKPNLRFGMITDMHFADVNSRGNRYYRQSLNKLTEFVQVMKDQEVEFIIELGDFKDEDSPPNENSTLKYLRRIEEEFRRGAKKTFHVLGNHDVDSISKAQFQSEITNTGIPNEHTFYSFVEKDIQFIVLDANYRSDGKSYDRGNFDWTDSNIPQNQLKWLRHELEKNSLYNIVFVHQLLDGEGSHFINNASEVRQILERSKKVLAVFNGHQHTGRYNIINDIHYYTLKAVVEGQGTENNAYAIVEISADNNIVINGYRRVKTEVL